VKDPAELTVLEVVELLDGEVGGELAGDPDRQEVWGRAVTSLREVLGGTTIADIVQQESESAGAQMYHI
jgi:Rrf2 family cysteine metabolism transcriptional repressor